MGLGEKGLSESSELAGHAWESPGGYAKDDSKENRAQIQSVAGVK